MRSFVAIELPDDTRAALEAVQEHLRVGILSDPDSLHLTLAFLGDLPETVLEEVHLSLQGIRQPSFTLQLRGLGVFGSKAPRVVWAGIVPNPELSALHKQVRGAVRRAGVDLPRERFRPHVTLARLKARLGPEELDKLRLFLERFDAFPSPPIKVAEIVLFQSILASDGAIHHPLAEYALE